MILNPFTIGPEHNDHSDSTEIIKLEESGQVFCPLCLSLSQREIEGIRDDIFERYVRGLFEALDQHGEKQDVRRIFLSILEIILSRRSIQITGAHDFHNLLRVVYKILRSEKFTRNELSAISSMFSAITKKFTNADPIPLVSVSKATEVIVECAATHLAKCLDENANNLRSDVIKLLGSVYATINAYLELLGRFSMGRSSDLIFPLYENDEPQMHSRDYHKNCQIRCLNFTYTKLFPVTIRHLRAVDRLDKLDRELVLGFFETLRESYLSSTRVEHNEFINYVIKEDCLSLAHSFNYRSADIDLRNSIKSFLKAYVFHYIETKFQRDSAFQSFAAQSDLVETNHKNAIAYSLNQSKSNRAIFYVMVSYVAYNQDSHYYKQDRLRKVICDVDPSLYFATKSTMIIKVYLYMASTVLRTVSTVENIEKFFRRLWNQIKDGASENGFDDEFCSSEKIFFWAFRHPTFKKLVTWSSIKCLVERGFSRISIARNTLKLINDEFYKERLVKYIENDESSIELIKRLNETIDGCDFHVGDRYHKPLMTELGAIIPALLYDSIEKLINDLDNAENMAKTQRLTKVIMLWIEHRSPTDLLLDDDFITAWFRVLDEIMTRHGEDDKKYENLVVQFLQLICSLMEKNHNQLNRILSSLNYTSLGLMYTRLIDYTLGDELAERIAHLIMVYDKLDYPLKHDPVNGLLELKPNILNWTLSGSRDLHALSIRCVEKTFKDLQSATTKVAVATGLINMIALNPEVLEIKEHADIMKSIISEDEILHNPLLQRIKNSLPADLLACINEGLIATQVPPSPSPPLSFASDESDILEEENISVMRILTQLQNEENIEVDTSCTIPETLYVSKALVDRHVNSVDTGDWERLALESQKNRSQTV